MLCCGYTLTDFPISIRLTSLALWQSNDCPSASKATLMNMDKCFMWIHYERLHNHNKAKHNKTVCIFLGIYCIYDCLIIREVDKTIANHNKTYQSANRVSRCTVYSVFIIQRTMREAIFQLDSLCHSTFQTSKADPWDTSCLVSAGIHHSPWATSSPNSHPQTTQQN